MSIYSFRQILLAIAPPPTPRRKREGSTNVFFGCDGGEVLGERFRKVLPARLHFFYVCCCLHRLRVACSWHLLYLFSNGVSQLGVSVRCLWPDLGSLGVAKTKKMKCEFHRGFVLSAEPKDCIFLMAEQ